MHTYIMIIYSMDKGIEVMPHILFPLYNVLMYMQNGIAYI